ncbi:hypothetical protein Taro_017197 [Colocasia esculenta]|uniref:chitinase n=1 Tax=Colocasia esculenta TaxID=4460 RepID=A0A843UQS0_COLES|nr:hypothetical protein [Colocasia esculenta]
MISFLSKFGEGRTPKINFAEHCDPTYDGCTIGVRNYQAFGVKVLLSIGNGAGSYGLFSAVDAQKVAQYLWDNFLGERLASRLLADAVLDDVDFDIEEGPNPTLHYGQLAQALKDYGAHAGRRVFISAAPQCPFPDAHLGRAINTDRDSFVRCRSCSSSLRRVFWVGGADLGLPLLFPSQTAVPSAPASGDRWRLTQ